MLLKDTGLTDMAGVLLFVPGSLLVLIFGFILPFDTIPFYSYN